MRPVASYSLTQKDVVTQPWEYYARMRGEEPVHYDEGARAWLVTRYSDILQAVQMTDVLSNEFGWDNLRESWQDEIDEMMRREAFGPHRAADNFKVDGVLHSTRRKLVEQAFSASRVTAMEAHIGGLARRLVDKFIDRGEAEIAAELSVPLGLLVIAGILNVPESRLGDMHRWSDASVAGFGMGITKEEGIAYARDIMEMHRFLAAEFDKRRADPGDDIVSALVHAKDEAGNGLNMTELLSICVALLTAGNETTRNAMSFGTLIMARDPDLFDRLRNAEDQNRLLQRFVEETLRLEPTVPQLPRYALEDCEIGGQKIAKGDNILLCWASGNHDEAKFPMPTAFQLDRNNSRHHLTFGAGIYSCVGAMLARMEMKCCFRELVTRMERLELAIPEDEIEIWGTFVFRGPRRVPVRFTKAGAAS
ncbi:MAG TPA: cytochrome P450 [Stellaceae bacterium]|nr:cytochrome P450 [Stellaceae bacterium]